MAIHVFISYYPTALSLFVYYANQNHINLPAPTHLAGFITNRGRITTESITQNFEVFLNAYCGPMTRSGNLTVSAPNSKAESRTLTVGFYKLIHDRWVQAVLMNDPYLKIGAVHYSERQHHDDLCKFDIVIDTGVLDPFE